jgi:hypothetical protein
MGCSYGIRRRPGFDGFLNVLCFLQKIIPKDHSEMSLSFWRPVLFSLKWPYTQTATPITNPAYTDAIHAPKPTLSPINNRLLS